MAQFLKFQDERDPNGFMGIPGGEHDGLWRSHWTATAWTNRDGVGRSAAQDGAYGHSWLRGGDNMLRVSRTSNTADSMLRESRTGNIADSTLRVSRKVTSE